ncbi:MAG: LicD family protein, partial [Synergistaceae bacterium]|nr:LicD family protein [Synergistaceae bacterium]
MMKALDVEGLKKVELEILDVVAKFCDEHDIKYWLCYGTLIGAIRHKGFIPWDDDIDIAMLRPDYEKFMELFNKHNTRYRFSCSENDPDFPRYWGRVSDTNTVLIDSDFWKTHIYVDIFCWDHAPDDVKALKKMFLRKHIYWRLYLLQFFPLRIRGANMSNILRKTAGFIAR